MNDPLAPLRSALEGRYEIQRELGQGAFATVYLARDMRHARQVAIKVLTLDRSSDLSETRFLREIRYLAGLQHPNILPLHDSGHVLDLLYYVMPYVRGESLRDRIHRERQLTVAEAVRIAAEIADGLDHAHRSGIIHRDIKPENILLSGQHPMLADFGIARSLGGARAQQLTKTGLGSPGTPAYMSPEQMLGEHELDNRSDIYSLGCVLFEMLAGQAPFAGRGGFARRFTEPPPRISAVRPGVPDHVEEVIVRALARDPAERFLAASEMCEALTARREAPSSGTAIGAPPASPAVSVVVPGAKDAPASSPGSATPSVPAGREPRTARRVSRRRLIGAGVGVLLLALALIPLAKRLVAGADLDSSAYVVLPFAAPPASGGPPSSIDGEDAQLMLHESLSRWRDLELVSRMRVNDAAARRGGAEPTLEGALETARSLGAGILVWGTVSARDDSLEVRAALYDVARGGDPLREHVARFARREGDARAGFGALADVLLTGADAPRALAGAAGGTRSLAAWRAYERGHGSLAAWDLDGAEREFRVARELDPDYAHAALWLAQVMAWSGSGAARADEWRDAAARAAALRQALPARDASVATALAALSARRFPDACAGYKGLVAADSLDFAAWYGLGECNRLDALVVRSAGSPSGWRFRSSYETALTAYDRALQLVPSMHHAFRGLAFGRLPRLLFTEPNRYRAGFAVERDTVRFGAFPSLDRDTLAFVPYPLADIIAGRPGARPSSATAALARNRVVMRRIASAWTSAFPASPDAHEALARTLESSAEVSSSRAGAPSALQETRRARELASDPAARLRLAHAEVRLRLKAEDFTGAQALADSVLAAAAPRGEDEIDMLAGLAAVTGRVGRCADLLGSLASDWHIRLPDDRMYSPAPALGESVLRLHAQAALGAPSDTVRALVSRIDRQVRSYVSPAERSRVRAALLARPMSLAFPELGPDGVRGIDARQNMLLQMQQMLVSGDTMALRARLAALRASRDATLPGATTMDQTYQEAWLLLAMSDTAAAVQALDLPLGALPTFDNNLLDPAEAGALVRAMALRARLGAAAGDRETAVRWARAVLTLWSNGDAGVQDATARMRGILAAPRG